MKKDIIHLLALTAILLWSSCCTNKVKPVIEPDKDIETRIEKILSGMTLEEKVGQMAQITILLVLRRWRAGRKGC